MAGMWYDYNRYGVFCLFIKWLSVFSGGESVSQSPLMSKLFFIPERGNLRSWLPAIGPSCAPAAPQASAPSSVDLDAAVGQAISAASLGKWALFTAQSRLTTTLGGHIGGTFHFTPCKDRLQFPYANSETALTRGTVRKSLCARRNIG
jgi:hypothetical protein